MDVSDMDMMDMDVVEKKTNTNTKTQATTNTKCFKDPMYVIYLNRWGFKDFKNDMVVMDMDVVDIKTNTNTKCFEDKNKRWLISLYLMKICYFCLYISIENLESVYTFVKC